MTREDWTTSEAKGDTVADAPERLLTPDEIGARLGISPATAKDWLRVGRLPSVKLGRKGLLRMREAELNAYIRGLKGRTKHKAAPVHRALKEDAGQAASGPRPGEMEPAPIRKDSAPRRDRAMKSLTGKTARPKGGGETV